MSPDAFLPDYSGWSSQKPFTGLQFWNSVLEFGDAHLTLPYFVGCAPTVFASGISQGGRAPLVWIFRSPGPPLIPPYPHPLYQHMQLTLGRSILAEQELAVLCSAACSLLDEEPLPRLCELTACSTFASVRCGRAVPALEGHCLGTPILTFPRGPLTHPLSSLRTWGQGWPWCP